MRSRRTLLLVAALWSVGRPTLAQDRLFVSSGEQRLEIGAIGRFGQPIGPAPADAFTRTFPTARHFRATAVEIAHAESGVVVYSAPPGQTISSWDATPDASRLFVITQGVGFSLPWLRAVDVASRVVVAELQPPGAVSSVFWLPGDRVMVRWAGSNRVDAFDRDLRLLAELGFSTACLSTWLDSPHTGRAYVLHFDGYSYGGYGAYLTAFDTIDGSRIGQVDLTQRLGLPPQSSCFGVGLTLWTAPGAPQRLAAVVLGRDVTLSWLATDLAEGYVLDVGLAPGRTDLSFFVGSTTGVTFASVPPGAYYVRVRAGNVAGGGRPSQEVQMVVP